jgi:hypothetical protein
MFAVIAGFGALGVSFFAYNNGLKPVSLGSGRSAWGSSRMAWA